MKTSTRFGPVGNALAAAWILCTTAIFLVRFSGTFYHANETAIQNAVSRVSGLLGLNP